MKATGLGHVILGVSMLFYCVKSPAPDVCIAFESSYHIEKECECVVFESYGGTQGTFSSVNFPSVYPTSLKCILYTFVGDLDELVEISFVDFDLPPPSPINNRCSDFVKLFVDLDRPEVGDQQNPDYELCGNISTIHKFYYSAKRSLILEFHTDAFQTNNTGFRGAYRFLEKGQFDVEGGTKRWDTDCTYDFRSGHTKSGRFFSPRYPQPYGPNSYCQYFFYGLPNERVKINFTNIQMELGSVRCHAGPAGDHRVGNRDVITIRDGLEMTSPIISRFCGTGTSVEVVSSEENLTIELISDDLIQQLGFAALFRFVHQDQIIVPSTKPTLKAFNLRGWTKEPPKQSDKPSPRDSPVLQKFGSKDWLERCDVGISSTEHKTGIFTSPKYPAPYPKDTTCRYVLKGQGRERVQIHFIDFDLSFPQEATTDAQTNECEDVDTLTVSVLSSTAGDVNVNKEIGRFCGSVKPPSLMSSDHTMVVIFHSLSTSFGGPRWFKANYSFVLDYGIKTGEQLREEECSFVYRSEVSMNGTFTSPNYPGFYPRSTECHYKLIAKDDERVEVTFTHLDVDGVPPGCLPNTHSDFIELSNFNVPLPDRKLMPLCGNNRDPLISPRMTTVTSDGNFFRVTFRSNDVYDATGFNATYVFKPNDPDADPWPSASASSWSRQSGDCNKEHVTLLTTIFLSVLTTFSSVRFLLRMPAKRTYELDSTRI